MILRYITYLIFIQGFYGILGNIFLFPIAYVFREMLRENTERNFYEKILYGLLHDYRADDIWGDYGNEYTNPKLKKTFWIAWRWVWRNPIHNWQVAHKFEGKRSQPAGWETCQRDNAHFMWRTTKTKNSAGVFQDKKGKFIDLETSVLGIQWITFMVGDKKVFRFSGSVPLKLWKNTYWIFSYKFGFESVNWAIQFQPFKTKKLMNGEGFKLERYSYL